MNPDQVRAAQRFRKAFAMYIVIEQWRIKRNLPWTELFFQRSANPLFENESLALMVALRGYDTSTSGRDSTEELALAWLGYGEAIRTVWSAFEGDYETLSKSSPDDPHYGTFVRAETRLRNAEEAVMAEINVQLH